jgi:predicted cupin superfamily sugar epimerase
MHEKALYYIKKLQLKKHPEGGYFREIYRAGDLVLIDAPNKRVKRNFSTSIYFLLAGKQISAFHKLNADEIWHFYDGSPVKIYIIDPDGKFAEVVLGKKTEKGEVFQITINKNHWFAAEVLSKKSFVLVGCTVSPGFDFSDFKLGRRDEMIKLFPQHKLLCEKFALR